MLIKICGITNQADAQAAIDEGATALGFNFYKPSPRYIAPEAAAALTAKLPANVLKVGVFVNESAADVAAITATAGLDVAQLHGDETPANAPTNMRLWKAYRVRGDFSADRFREFPAEAYLLDSPTELYGGSGHPFDWNLARGIGGKIVLAGGLDASNVMRAIETARPWGVDACSRLESEPGKKDRKKLAAFMKVLRDL